jgi:MFS family permease
MSSRRERLTTIALMGAAAVTEKMDEGVLPSVFLAVGASLGVGPAELGAVALCRALAQAAASPLAGALGDSLDRTRVVSVGCLLWALATLLLATATSLGQMVLLAALNGLGLSLALPALQSVVADAVPAGSRGSAFGAVGLAAGVGGMLAAFSATAAARRRFFGVEGWRVAFVAVALVSALVGALSWFLAVDPRDRSLGGGGRGGGGGGGAARRRRRDKQQEKLSDPGELRGGGGGGGAEEGEGLLMLSSTSSTAAAAAATRTLAAGASPPPPTPAPFSQVLRRYLQDTLAALHAVARIPSFRVVVAQGVMGSMPWNAMLFATLWLQLLGFTDVAAGALAALFAASCAFGSLLGGSLGDAAARETAARRPNGSSVGSGSSGSSSVGGVGRVAVAQLSVAASIPLAVLLLRVLPSSGPCRCQENVGGVVVGRLFPHGAASSANAACSPRSASCTAAFSLVITVMGLFSSWCGSNNSAVFAEIVPAELRSSVYAFDRSFEGAVGALATPLVGVVASKVFGFKGALAGAPSSSSSSSGSSSSSPLNLSQANALGSALVVCCVVPWATCLAAYTLLYRFYPLDAAAASEASAVASAAAGRGGGESERMAAAAPAPAPASSLELVEGSLFRAPPSSPPPPHPAPPPAAASTSSASSGSLLERGVGAGASSAAARKNNDDEAASSSSSPLPPSSSSTGVFGRLLRRPLEPQRRR